MDGYIITTVVAVGAQAVLLLAALVPPRRLSAQAFYRLSAMAQFVAAGAMAGGGRWWGAVPVALAALTIAVAAATEPQRRARHAHLAALIHADRTPSE